MTEIILASASPRRQELLSQVGIPFRVIISGVEEYVPAGAEPEEIVVKLAEQKASFVAKNLSAGYVLGADTVVVLENQILGKPSDSQEAVRMLMNLSGKTHQVMTGVCIIEAKTGKTVSTVEITEVKMRAISLDEIYKYVATGEPLDKAGAYAIQGKGAIFVESIKGCFSNVVGLPIFKVVELFTKLGVTPFEWSQENDCPKD